MTVQRYEFITRTATKVARSWTNREVAQFHAFNPNGLCAKKFASDEVISRLVEEGKANSGALLAHGSMADFEYDRLMEQARNRRVGRIDIQVAVEMMEDKLDRVQEFIASKQA